MIISGWPVCAVCKKPVDVVEQWDESFERDVIVFVVRCHGSEQRHELRRCDVVEAYSIVMGEAFTDRLLDRLLDG